MNIYTLMGLGILIATLMGVAGFLFGWKEGLKVFALSALFATTFVLGVALFRYGISK